MIDPQPSLPVRLVAVAYLWIPYLALAALGAWFLGARVLALIAGLVIAVWLVKRSASGRRPRMPAVQLILVSIAFAVLGAIAFGAIGFFGGLAAGFMLGLDTSYELTVRNRKGELAPFDPLDPVQEATIGKAFGLTMVASFGVALAVLVFLAATK
jgi:hypothetical protein